MSKCIIHKTPTPGCSECPPPPVPLAKEHRGMKIHLRGATSNVGVRGGWTPKQTRFLMQGVCEHLEEVARRYYSGDIAVVDEFLQLYCFNEHRPKLESEEAQ